MRRRRWTTCRHERGKGEGDFEAIVTVTLAPPKKNIEDAGKSPYLVAGLAACGKDGRYAMRARLFSSLGVGGKAANADGWESAWYHRDPSREVPGGSAGGHGGFDNTFQPCDGLRLRLHREGTKVSYAESTDGKGWKDRMVWECDLPETVRVGVFGLNTTNAECTATFSDFTVTPLKPAEKK